jgi:hypothetical protein
VQSMNIQSSVQIKATVTQVLDTHGSKYRLDIGSSAETRILERRVCIVLPSFLDKSRGRVPIIVQARTEVLVDNSAQ